MASYDIGDLVRITGTFTNAGGTAIDPSGTVLFTVVKPDNVTTVYTYGSGTDVVKASTGVYYVDVPASIAGRYHWRSAATGAVGTGADETWFDVGPSSFSGERAGMSYLVERWRRYVNDTAGSVWSDTEAVAILDQYRNDLWGRELDVREQRQSGSIVYKKYLVGCSDLETFASGTAAWNLYDANGSAIGTANYTADYARGIVSFTADQKGSARYVDARSYDVHGAAAQGWRELAGAKASLYRFSADGASYDRNQWYDHCWQMAAQYDKLATSGAGGIGVSYMYRGDVSNATPIDD